MATYPLTVEEQPEARDLEVVRQGLYAFNLPHTGEDRYRPLAVFVRDDGGTPVAGLTGATYWGWLYVEILWVREDLRGKGFGSRMLAAAEEEAVRRGCERAHLDTFGFQAPAFYRARGYEFYGELPDFVAGHTRYYLTKRLAPPDGGGELEAAGGREPS